MDRSKFVRIYSHDNKVICICCDEFVTIQQLCPPDDKCGCRPHGNGHCRDDNRCVPFNNRTDKIIATILDCKADEILNCSYDCNHCNFTIAKLKYLQSIC